MTRRRIRNAEEWRRHVFRARVVETVRGEHRRVDWSVTVLAQYLADYMTEDRKVSRPRYLIGRDLDVSDATVSRLLSEAVACDLLSRITRGHNGRTAVYQGMFPKIIHNRVAAQQDEPLVAAHKDEPLLAVEREPLLGGVAAQQDEPPLDNPDAPSRRCATDPCLGCPACTPDAPGGHVDWSEPHELVDDGWGSCLGCQLPAADPIHDRSAS